MEKENVAGCGDRVTNKPERETAAVDLIEISVNEISELIKDLKSELESEEPSLAYISGRAKKLGNEVMRILREVE